MLYAILIVACLAPTDCKTYERRVMDLPVLPVAQFMAAQTLVAEWAAQHPARKVKAFKVVLVTEKEIGI